LCIRELKKAVRYTLDKTGVPRRLWDYCTIYHFELRNLIAHPVYKLHGCMPYEVVTGCTPDISEYLDYSWYKTIWYFDQHADFPEPYRKMAKWLGVAHRVGQALCYYILPASGILIVPSTIQALTRIEKDSETTIRQIIELDHQIKDNISLLPTQDVPQELLDVNDDDYVPYLPVEPEAEKPDAEDYTPQEFDSLISAKVLLPKGNVLLPATVIGRKRDHTGQPLGTSNTNPMLDTRIYNVQFGDGHIKEYAANVMAGNIYSQLDPNGNRFLLLKEITDHRVDDTHICKEDKYISNGNNRHLRHTTKGWYLQVLWKDGTSLWEPLRNLKESNPFEVAGYAVFNSNDDEAASAWWVPHTLRKRDRIISSIKVRATKKESKFGIEIPRSVNQALEIDSKTGTDLWWKAIEKECQMCRWHLTSWMRVTQNLLDQRGYHVIWFLTLNLISPEKPILLQGGM
jgi:hypothetical protein